MLKVIKAEAEYRAALARVERLIEDDPPVGTPEADELELVSLLVEKYENERFPVSLPNPIEAIKFRMEQQALEQRDLVQFIGSPSKVSEVLSGKRPLSLSMIRSLNAGLGIPLEVLVQGRSSNVLDEEDTDEEEVDWSSFPLAEMARRGLISPDWRRAGDPKAIVQSFFAPLGGLTPVAIRYRRTRHTRSGRRNDSHALLVWRGQIMIRAMESLPPVAYVPGTITEDFMRTVARLSMLRHGPVAVKEFLSKHGIVLITEPQFPQTYIDGAALILPSGHPVIALTLRYDRLDNFWFTLLHELVHIARHVTDDDEYFDDLDSDDQGDPQEKEADEVASEALIPSEVWKDSGAKATRSPQAIERLAAALSIHPAIIAGRIRHEANDFRLLKQLVGQNEVRRWFPEVRWK